MGNDIAFIIRILGVLVTVTFGIYGLSHRTKSGELTQKGRLISIGVIIGGLISLASLVADQANALASSQKRADEYRSLLTTAQANVYSTSNALCRSRWLSNGTG